MVREDLSGRGQLEAMMTLLCKDRAVEHSRQQEQQVQRSWGTSILGLFKGQRKAVAAEMEVWDMRFENTGPESYRRIEQLCPLVAELIFSALGPSAAWGLAASSVMLGSTTVAVLGFVGGPNSLSVLRVFMVDCCHLSWPHGACFLKSDPPSCS